jgi:hypothetical protein
VAHSAAPFAAGDWGAWRRRSRAGSGAARRSAPPSPAAPKAPLDLLEDPLMQANLLMPWPMKGLEVVRDPCCPRTFSGHGEEGESSRGVGEARKMRGGQRF